MQKIYSKEDFKVNLQTNDTWLIRGLMAIYAKQTEGEKFTGVASEQNNMGFTGIDAEFLSSLAEQVEKNVLKGVKLQNSLSEKQKESLRKSMIKYAGQLHRISGMDKLEKDAKKAENKKFREALKRLKAGAYGVKRLGNVHLMEVQRISSPEQVTW